MTHINECGVKAVYLHPSFNDKTKKKAIALRAPAMNGNLHKILAASDPDGARMVPMHSKIDTMLLYLACVNLVLKGLSFESVYVKPLNSLIKGLYSLNSFFHVLVC